MAFPLRGVPSRAPKANTSIRHAGDLLRGGGGRGPVKPLVQYGQIPPDGFYNAARLCPGIPVRLGYRPTFMRAFPPATVPHTAPARYLFHGQAVSTCGGSRPWKRTADFQLQHGASRTQCAIPAETAPTIYCPYDPPMPCSYNSSSSPVCKKSIHILFSCDNAVCALTLSGPRCYNVRNVCSLCFVSFYLTVSGGLF
jgi:hypothetical protein